VIKFVRYLRQGFLDFRNCRPKVKKKERVNDKSLKLIISMIGYVFSPFVNVQNEKMYIYTVELEGTVKMCLSYKIPKRYSEAVVFENFLKD
jgi:hypothetical protein